MMYIDIYIYIHVLFVSNGGKINIYMLIMFSNGESHKQEGSGIWVSSNKNSDEGRLFGKFPQI